MRGTSRRIALGNMFGRGQAAPEPLDVNIPAGVESGDVMEVGVQVGAGRGLRWGTGAAAWEGSMGMRQCFRSCAAVQKSLMHLGPCCLCAGAWAERAAADAGADPHPGGTPPCLQVRLGGSAAAVAQPV